MTISRCFLRLIFVLQLLFYGFLLASTSAYAKNPSGSSLNAQVSNQNNTLSVPHIRITLEDQSTSDISAEFSIDTNSEPLSLQLNSQSPAKPGSGTISSFNQHTGLLEIPVLQFPSGDCGDEAFAAQLQSSNGELDNLSLTNLEPLPQEPVNNSILPNYLPLLENGQLFIPQLNVTYLNNPFSSFQVTTSVEETADGNFNLKLMDIELLSLNFPADSALHPHFALETGILTIPLAHQTDMDGHSSTVSISADTVNTAPYELAASITATHALQTSFAALSGSTISIFGIDDPATPIFSTTAEGGDNPLSLGLFTFTIPDTLNTDDWLLIKASNGVLLDKNGDGILSTACEHQGPLHALVPVNQLNTSILSLNILTELSYRLNQAYLGDGANLALQLDLLAMDLLQHPTISPISYKDVLQFNPLDPSNPYNPFTDYDKLFNDHNTGTLTLTESLMLGDETAILPAIARDTSLTNTVIPTTNAVRLAMNDYFGLDIDRFPPSLENMLHIISRYHPDESQLASVKAILQLGMLNNIGEQLDDALANQLSQDDIEQLNLAAANIRAQILTGNGSTAMPFGVHLLENTNTLFDPITDTVETVDFADNITLGLQRYGVGESDIFTFIDTRNHAPTAESLSVQVPEGHIEFIQVTATDSDNDELTYILLNEPSRGRLTGELPNIAYTGESAGEDSLQFMVNDGKRNSNIATISIDVLPPPARQPKPNTDTYSTLINTALIVDSNTGILSNDDLGNENQQAQLISFGGGDLGGLVSDNAAGSTVNIGVSGSLTVNADGSFSYDPDSGATGEIRFDYQVKNNLGSSFSTVFITTRQAPSAVNDTGLNTNLASPLTNSDILTNDTLGYEVADIVSFGGGNLGGTVDSYSAGSNLTIGSAGSISLNSNGDLNFTPDTNFIGIFSFDYKISNSVGDSTATISIQVNQAPSATGDSYSTMINSSLNIADGSTDLLANDTLGYPTASLTGFGGGSLSGSSNDNNAGTTVNVGSSGSLTVNADGSFDFTPDTNDIGIFTFDYVIQSSSGSSTATATITIFQAPTANSDNYNTTINTPLSSTTILSNDTQGYEVADIISFGGGSLGGTVDSYSAGSNLTIGSAGSISLNSNGDLNFTPDTNFIGIFSFDYKIGNSVGDSTATISIQVNQAPSATGDSYNTMINSSLNIADGSTDLLANDTLGYPTASLTGFGGGSLGGSSNDNNAGSTANVGSSGSLTVNADGSFDFTPDTNDIGIFTFDYVIQSSSGSSTATATITIFQAPTANGDNYSTAINTPLSASTVLTNDSLGYEPASIISFGGGDLGGTVDTNTAGSNISLGSGGSISLSSNGQLNMTPNTNFIGNIGFEYKIQNSSGISTASISIDVTQAPNASADTYSVEMNNNLTIADGAGDLMDNDNTGFPFATISHFGGGSLGGSVTDNSANSTANFGSSGSLQANTNGAVSFTPDTNSTGNFTFDYRLTNSINSSTTTVSVFVYQLPIAVNDAGISTSKGVALSYNNILSNDTLGVETASIVSFGGGDLGGTVDSNLAGSSFSFGGDAYLSLSSNGILNVNPPDEFYGDFTFQYKLQNTYGDSTASITISVSNPPSAENDSYSTNLNTTLSITDGSEDLLVNDDPGSPASTIVSFGDGSLGGAITDHTVGSTVNIGADGSLQVNSDGSFSFTPESGSPSDLSFQYRISNTSGTSDATVTINVRTPPSATNDTIAAAVNTTINFTGLLDNDNLGDPAVSGIGRFGGGDASPAITYNAGETINLGAGGSLTINTDGSGEFTPNTGFSGNFTVFYEFGNSAGTSNGQVTFNVVAGGNLAPQASNDSGYSTDYNTPLTVTDGPDDLLINDNLGSPTASITSFGGGSLGGNVSDNTAGSSATGGNASLTVNADGSFTFTPTISLYSGYTYTFDYQITNSEGSSTATASIYINRTASAVDDSYTTTLNTTLSISSGINGLLDNDSTTNPPLTLYSFGGGSLGGFYDSNAAGATVNFSAGTLTVNSDGSFDLIPANNFTGSINFEYQAYDSSSPFPTLYIGNVHINILDHTPVAVNDSYTMAINSTFNFNSLLDNDTTGLSGSIGRFGGGSLGGSVNDHSAGTTLNLGSSGSLLVNSDGTGSFTPNNNFQGTFTFDYVLFTGSGTSTATVSIDVNNSGNVSPVAVTDSFNTAYNNTLTINDGPSDLLNNDSLGSPAASITSFGGGSLGGSVIDNTAGSNVIIGDGSLQVNNDGSFSYDPASDFTGTFSFDYQITNASGTSTATVNIDVQGILPIAFSNDYETAVDTLLAVATGAADILSNDTVGTPAASISHFGGGSLGGSTGDNAAGSTITVGSTGSLQVNSDGSFNFQPDTGFSGSFSFEYRLSSAIGSSDSTVHIQVHDPATAVNDSFTTSGALVDNVLSNDTVGNPNATVARFGGGDLGGDVNLYSVSESVNLGSGGLLSVSSNGTLIFIPNTGFTGAFSFDYKIQNSAGTSTATVTITVL